MPARKSAPKTMSDTARLAKNNAIREAGIATRARRVGMNVKIRDLKISESNLSLIQKDALRSLFLEYKWIRNAAIAAENFNDSFLKELDGQVPVRLPDGTIEQREIRWLGSQMQQSVLQELKNNLKALSVLKKNGRKTGRLGYVREANSIELKQFGITYRFKNDTRKQLKVQNVPGWLRIRGYEQLTVAGVEFANAHLVKRSDGYHVLVTVYEPKSEMIVPDRKIGVDFGVKNAFTLDDGTVVNAMIDETGRLRRLQRKLSRQVKGSSGYRRTQDRIRREYLRMDYRKDDLANQLVRSWSTQGVVYYQDENISAWKKRDSGSRGSRKIHHGIMGRVKNRLARKQNIVMLPKWVATTAWCSECGGLTPHNMEQRVFVCSHCGFAENRDTHAAKNMVILGDKYLKFTSGIEGSAGGETVRLKTALYKVVPEQVPVKPETVKSSVSP